MAGDIHLKLGSINGESNDDKHKGEIDVLSWSWGMTQTGSTGKGGGGGVGKVGFQDIVVTHYVDKASPNIMNACATFEPVAEAILTVRKAGKTPQEYLIIKMNDVLVTSVQPAANGNGESPVEQFTLQFAKVDLEYKPQKPDGSLDAGLHFKYDVTANKAG
jgi:type VI secretion system secreted protein Hcp